MGRGGGAANTEEDGAQKREFICRPSCPSYSHSECINIDRMCDAYKKVVLASAVPKCRRGGLKETGKAAKSSKW
jgi:hypothetical protein